MPTERTQYRTLDQDEIVRQLRFLYANFQNRNFTIVSAAPTVSTIDNGEFKILDTGSGTRSVYTKIAGALYSFNLTAV